MCFRSGQHRREQLRADNRNSVTRGRPTKIRDWRRHSIDLPRVVAIASKFRSIEDASTAMPLTDQRQQRRRDTKQRRRRDLLGRLLRWRVGLHWYLFVLFGLPMGVLLSAIVLHGAAPLGALARNWGLLFTCSCWASSCPSCTPTCGRSLDGRVSCSQRCRTGAGPCLRA